MDAEPEQPPALPENASHTQIVDAINGLARATIELARIVDDNRAEHHQLRQRLAPFLQRLATALDGKP